MSDPYTTLGVASTATDEEISKAYKKLARQYHPDLNPGDRNAEMKMKEINAAYESIKDIRSGKKAYTSADSPYGRSYSDSGNDSRTDPFGAYRSSYGGRYYGFDFSEFFTQAQQQRQESRQTYRGSGIFGFFGSIIRFTLIMALLRLLFSFFFFPVF